MNSSNVLAMQKWFLDAKMKELSLLLVEQPEFLAFPGLPGVYKEYLGAPWTCEKTTKQFFITSYKI